MASRWMRKAYNGKIIIISLTVYSQQSREYRAPALTMADTSGDNDDDDDIR